MKTHDLKIYPQYFEDVRSGRKTFEIRKNDRNYKVGDLLQLIKYNPLNEALGGVIKVEITYILDDRTYLQKGYVALGIKVLN